MIAVRRFKNPQKRINIVPRQQFSKSPCDMAKLFSLKCVEHATIVHSTINYNKTTEVDIATAQSRRMELFDRADIIIRSYDTCHTEFVYTTTSM